MLLIERGDVIVQKRLRTNAFLTKAMDDFGDTVYGLALCRLGARADAEDVFQEVFLRLLCDETDFTDEEHLKSWLLRVTISRCTDLRRSAWFRRTIPMEAIPETAAPIHRSYDALWQAVGALPSQLREAVYLYYAEGYRTDEIAQLLDCNPATVRTRLHRARKRLKLDLEGEQYEIYESTQ